MSLEVIESDSTKSYQRRFSLFGFLEECRSRPESKKLNSGLLDIGMNNSGSRLESADGE